MLVFRFVKFRKQNKMSTMLKKYAVKSQKFVVSNGKSTIISFKNSGKKKAKTLLIKSGKGNKSNSLMLNGHQIRQLKSVLAHA